MTEHEYDGVRTPEEKEADALIDATLARIEKENAEIHKFDFRDPKEKERLFRAHSFTDEQMKDLVEDLDRNTRRACRPSEPLIKFNPCDIDKHYCEGLEKHRIECTPKKKKLGFFKKSWLISKTIVLNTINKYRNLRHRVSCYIRGRLPRVECTEEHFCERHQREYDVIFKDFKKSRDNNIRRF